MEYEIEVTKKVTLTLDQSEIVHLNTMFDEYLELRRALPPGSLLGAEKSLLMQDFRDIQSSMNRR